MYRESAGRMTTGVERTGSKDDNRYKREPAVRMTSGVERTGNKDANDVERTSSKEDNS